MSEEKKQKSDEIKEFGALMLNENKELQNSSSDNYR